MSSNDETSGALDLAWQINGGAEFGYYNFSPETCEASDKTLLEETNPGNIFWGTGKGSELADTSSATISLLEKAGALETGEEVVFDEEIEVYKSAITAQTDELKKTMDKEIAAMKELTILLK